MKIKLIFNLFFLSILFIVFEGCKRDERVHLINKEVLTGLIQKGPFVNGTSISLSELSSSMDQTGKVFTTQISDNSGSFEINNISLTSSFVQLAANGFYFDEVQGSLSSSQLNLYALSDITDISTINVNIITHLEKLRVEYLVSHNQTFSEAKKTAQSEILAIFGFSLSEMDNSESLDISVNNEGNAILLAISVILQGNRSVAVLSELLANISNDIREDGILNNQNIISDLKTSTKSLYLSSIRTNLENRFKELGINASVPDFEKYIRSFLSITGLKPTVRIGSTFLDIDDVMIYGYVNANSLSTNITFEYGTTPNYGSFGNVRPSQINGSKETDVDFFTDSLSVATLYHYRIKAENILGITYSNDSTFRTLGDIPTISSRWLFDLTTSSVNLIFSVNGNYLSTNVILEYGPSSSYGIVLIPNPSTSPGGIQDFRFNLKGLKPGTMYHYRVKAENELGVSYSNDFTFTTLGNVPIVNTLLTTNLTSTSITLNAQVNPNYLSTVVAFEYGLSSSFGNTINATPSPVSGSTLVNVSANLSGLLPNTIYHIQPRAINEAGVVYGSEISFKTSNVEIGQNYQGGIVAYVIQSGDLGYDPMITHGIIAAPNDLNAPARWGCYGNLINGADGYIVGTGWQNTLDIINSCADDTIAFDGSVNKIAALQCHELVLNGYSDWYLPSKDELKTLYTNRAIIGNFNNSNNSNNSIYLSSTESLSIYFWGLSFRDGNFRYDWRRDMFHSVRAIRSF